MLLIIAGVLNASFALPMRFARKCEREHIWLAWSVFALLVFPALLSTFTVPVLGDVYQQAEWGPVTTVVACGLGLGIAQVFLFFAVDALGIRIALPIVGGISATCGSIITLLTKHPDKVYTPSGMSVILGAVLVAIAVSLLAAAGRSREVLAAEPNRIPFLRGFGFSVIAGFGSALVALALEWGTAIVRAAKAAGAAEIWRPNSIWLLLMVAAAVPNIAYCIYLMWRNSSIAKLKHAGTAIYWLLACGMAALWFGSTVIYGISTILLGSFGGAIAWPVYISMIVITSSMVGFGWRRTGRLPVITETVGIGMLMIAIVVFSRVL